MQKAATTVVIAVRGGPEAKSRCRVVLGKAGCAALVRAMLGDMVAVLHASPRIAQILLVTPTPALAEGLPVSFICDGPEGGINAAFAKGAQGLTGPVLFLPGDLPELDGDAVDALLARYQDGHVLLVPSITDGGTGALLTDRPQDQVFAFGLDSLAAHDNAAQQNGQPVLRLDVEAFAHDLDCPEQLSRAALRGGPRTRALLAELLSERQAA
jgi:2-phospho-L-lactate guanylyltransferase